jgi:hypothetical protein
MEGRYEGKGLWRVLFGSKTMFEAMLEAEMG